MYFVNRRTGEYSAQDKEPTPREDYYALSEDEYNFYEPIHRRRAEMSTDWRSIDSAPKDGSRVLAWRNDWEEGPAFVRWIRNPRTETEFWNDEKELDYYEYETEPPTHWIPIPEPPRKDTE